VVPTLLKESRGAALLVLGSRGLGGFTGLLVGSTSVEAAITVTFEEAWVTEGPRTHLRRVDAADHGQAPLRTSRVLITPGRPNLLLSARAAS